MFDKAKQLYKLQKEAKNIKKKLKNTHIEAEFEGVIVIINGEQEVIEVRISQEALQQPEKLGERITKCFNKAIKKSQAIGAEMMKEVMGDFNLPGLS